MPILLPPLPSPSVPLVTGDGKMHADWYRFFTALRAYIATL